MLKSFKRYLRESRDDEEQVLRDLLSSGLISRSEFYDLAKESYPSLVPLQYTIIISMSVSDEHTTEETLEFLEREVSAIDQTYVENIEPTYHQDRRRIKFDATIQSYLDSDELSDALQLKLRDQGVLLGRNLVTEIQNWGRYSGSHVNLV